MCIRDSIFPLRVCIFPLRAVCLLAFLVLNFFFFFSFSFSLPSLFRFRFGHCFILSFSCGYYAVSSVSVSAAARSAYSYVSFLLFTEGWTRQRHGSTDTWYLIPHTRMFRFFVHRGGDSTAARQYWYLIPWYLIPLSTRVGKRWQIVWQAPRLGFVARHGKLLVSTPWFRFSSFFWCITFFCYSFLLFLRPNYPGMFPFTSSSCCFVPAAAICSSWVSIMRVVFVSYVFCPISEFLSVYLFYLFHLLFPWLACLLCSRTRYTNLWFAYVRTLVN